MRGSRYEITYYPLDESGAVQWERQLDREGAIGADKAMEYAKSYLTMEADRECRIIPGEFAGELTIKAGVVGSPEDLVAVIERYYVVNAGVENI